MNFEGCENELRCLVSDFIGAMANSYIFEKRLSNKKIELICDFSQYVRFKIDGKDEETRMKECMEKLGQTIERANKKSIAK